MWGARKCERGLFGIAAVDMTDEQRNLVSWSGLYENIQQHPNCPSDEVLEDDDLLDGWMIEQRKERERSHNQKQADGITNEKIRNADEVFLMADTDDDARKIDELNDERAKHIKRQRFKVLKEKGTVNELDMPDTRQELIRQVNVRLASLGK